MKGLGSGATVLTSYAGAPDPSATALSAGPPIGSRVSIGGEDRPSRVLVIDHNPADTEAITHYLIRDGHEVMSRNTGLCGLAAFHHHRPDLIILEPMLPGMDGLTACRELRKVFDIPIVMLTAWGSESDKVVGLEYGADDYVVKPFSPRELMLRVSGLLRRARASAGATCHPAAGAGADGHHLVDGELVLNLPSRTARRSGQPLALTSRGFDLLTYLLQNPGEVFTRKKLMSDVWGWTFGDSATVTVHVRRLREKIEPQPATPVRIATVWGVGYRYDVGMGAQLTGTDGGEESQL